MSVYKVAVEMSMQNGVSPVLGTIMRDLLGVEKKVLDVSGGFKAWHAALAGAAAILTGGAILSAMGAMVKKAEELVHVQQQMIAAGIAQRDVNEATETSWQMALKYGLKVSDVAKDIKEVRMVFGSTEHAMEFIEPLEKMRVVLNGVTEGSGNKARDAVYEMARAGELKGLQQPEDFVRYFDGMTRAITASGGKVTPQGFVQATQYGRIASQGWSEQFYTKYLPSLIQEFGPSQSGTALMSLYGSFVQGKSGKRNTEALDDLGLIEDHQKVIKNAHGDPTGFLPGALFNTSGLMANPLDWAQTTLREAIEKKLGRGYEANDNKVLEILSGITGNRNTAGMLAVLSLQNTRLQKDAGITTGAKGLDAADQFLKQDPNTAMTKFHSAIENLMTALGGPLVEPAVKMLNMLTDAINRVTQWAIANPEAVKIIGVALVGLAAGLTALGAVLIGGAIMAVIGPGGALIVGFTALGAALTALVAASESARAAISSIFDSVKSWFNSGGIENGGNRYTRSPPGGQGRGSAVPPPAAGEKRSDINLHIDGRKVASAVMRHTTEDATFSQSGAYIDRRRQWADPDVAFS